MRERDACGIGFVADAEGRVGRAIVEAAIEGLARVRHRGALAADGLSADGAGLLLPIPRRFFTRIASEQLSVTPDPADLGVVAAFAAGEADGDADAEEARQILRASVEDACAAEGIAVLGWRSVPVDETQVGQQARASMPTFLQAILLRRPDAAAPDAAGHDDAERRCYRARRVAEAQCRAQGVRHYFASWSFETVVYKSLANSDRLAAFYPDLEAGDFEAAHAVFHQRFSTNTAPTWERAQPFRLLGHNGEINTLQGNEHRMASRAAFGTVEVGLGQEEIVHPLLNPEDSDSGKLDAAVELLTRGGRSIEHAIAMLVPDAWEGQRDLPSEVRDFFRYHACLVEPWDGPAGLVFSDGRSVGASLDRNGLRPLRYQICDDGFVALASEAGAVSIAGHGKVRRGRLGPGEMLLVDPQRGGVRHDVEIKHTLALQAPYGDWVRDGLRPISSGHAVEETPDPNALLRQQVAFGLDKEEIAIILKPMATEAKEPTFSMGDDTPFAAVSSRPRPVHHYLAQRFAQVTNPSIDHLRERLVMSLRTCLGPRRPLLHEGPEAARLLELPTFFLYPEAVERLLEDQDPGALLAARIDCTMPVKGQIGAGGLNQAIERIASEAEQLVRDGVSILVLSDADISGGDVLAEDASDERAPVPSVLATGAVHHRLVNSGLRDHASIVVDTGEGRDVHAVACLLGYGANAVCPRLALESIAVMADTGQLGETPSSEAQARFQAAMEDGVLKIMSKMGISTLESYGGAQIFEVLGLAEEVVESCLTGTASQVGGATFAMLETMIMECHAASRSLQVQLASPGLVRYRKGGEYHTNNPEMIEVLQGMLAPDDGGVGSDHSEIEPDSDPDPADLRAAHLLQRAIRERRQDVYEQFSYLASSRPVSELRDLLELVPGSPPVPIEEVESASSIVTRFSTGAMSHGSLSAEAHETLALAMNMIGGKSNCGEGGEDPYRFRTRDTPRDRNSRIKQIASGRFGVTAEYCSFADELNIKMAQGSKPGEGGQLPGHKVTREIARLRHTQPGVGLISPPPHHDIYSIEDLAQLIFDLKQVNGRADVSVKLVAEEGVGTIAAGVAKALADVVQISGRNGGTGASPLSSIKHAGMPWELGLAETQRALVDNHLRERVRVRVDGGLKTGRDVVIAALLGADEYSFGTAAMLAEGCIMVRACHRDTCPTGIATQRPHLRAKFAGTPEGVATYMLFIAEEVRTILASLGLRSVDEAIGRVELLRQRDHRHDAGDPGNPGGIGDVNSASLDLGVLLQLPNDVAGPRHFLATHPIQHPRSDLGDRLVDDAFRAVWEDHDIELSYGITTADRAVGAALGGAIGIEWGDRLPPGAVTVRFTGSAGQSFGAFLTNAVTFELTGEANDYVGKAMSGGRIIIRAPEDDAGDPVLAGNTVLYGATGGQLLIAGRAGERFAVRNSGASAVVEGTGDHACEYMTGGMVVILGPFGYNLGAGMTGGECYVYDPDGLLTVRLNTQLVEASSPDGAQAAELRMLVQLHQEFTGSLLSTALLVDWEQTLRHCWRVAPVGEIARIERMHEGVLGASR